MVKPTIYRFNTCAEFAGAFELKKTDLLITNER